MPFTNPHFFSLHHQVDYQLMVTVNSSIPAWIVHFLACMGGCFGCFTKPTPVIAVDEPSKGLRIQGRVVTKPSVLDDFWSSSTCDLDNSTVQSQRSISSISLPNQNPGSSTGGMSSNGEFVNHGLLLWQLSRLQWIGCGTSGNQNQRRWGSRSSWNATYEGLLGSRNPFPKSIPLSEMVSFLVDAWEQEGLND